MSFDCPTGDRQPKTGTAPLTGTRFINPIESVEDIGLMGSRNSGPSINDIETRLLVLTRMYSNENATLDGRIFDCIIQKIDNGLTKNQAIGGNNDTTVSFHAYLLPFLLPQHFESGSRLRGNAKE